LLLKPQELSDGCHTFDMELSNLHGWRLLLKNHLAFALLLFSLTTFVSTTILVHADEKVHPEMIQIDSGQVTVYPTN